ncbi:MAG: hypothetical protein AB1416_13465 [Actinomycetota bacterium]
MLSDIALLLIAFIAPWGVHLAPPHRRPVVLVILIAALLLIGIFGSNPLTGWHLWAGLLAGVLSAVAVSVTGGRSRPGHRHRGGRSRRRGPDPSSEPTGEI